MTVSHNLPSLRWRTVGPHWCSVQQRISTPSNVAGTALPIDPSSTVQPMQRGMHSSYLNAISRPDLNLEYQRNLKNVHNNDAVATAIPSRDLCPALTRGGQADNPMHDSALGYIQDSSIAFLGDQQQHQLQQQNETQPNLSTDHKHQQQLHREQLQLMQRLPGGTALPWYPTFGPAALPSTCSDRTIILTNPQQYTMTNHTKLNKPPVGPHWRSISNSPTVSPTATPPPRPPLSTERAPMGKKEDCHHFPQRTAISTLAENEIATTTPTPAFPSPESLSYSGMTSVSHVQKLSYEPGREMTEARNLFDGDNSDRRRRIQHHLLHYGADQPTLPNKDNSIISSSTALPRYDIQSRSNLQRGPPGGGYAFKRSMKRKATWEDEEMMMDSVDTAGPGSASAPLSQHSIPTTSAQDQRMSQVTEMQDQEMDCDRYDCEPMTATPEDCSSGQMSVDIGTPSSVDQQDFERSDSSNHNEFNNGMMGPIWSAKRTKPRLELVAIPGSAFAEMEARRREVGQIELDIFQQCFYNAAATSR